MIPSIGVINPTLSKNGLLNGLVSAYEFEETSGSTAFDSDGTNDGTINGATINQTGKVGQCYDYDGTNDYTSLPSAVRPTSNFTISLWYNADNYGGTYPALFGGEGLGNATAKGGIAISFFSSLDRMYLDIYSSTDRYSNILYDVSTTLPTGNWHHIVLRYDGTTFSSYQNNTLIDSKNIGSITIDWSGYIGSDVGIGRMEQAGSYYYFDGKIDEVMIWNRALSTDDIAVLYNSGSGLAYSQFTT